MTENALDLGLHLSRLIEVLSDKLAIVYFWFASADDEFRPLLRLSFAALHPPVLLCAGRQQQTFK